MTAQQQQDVETSWTLFDERRQKVYGGTFRNEHEAWQRRDAALLPSNIVPKRAVDVSDIYQWA